jgi:fumarate reductase flavoprotein subunit
MTETRAFDLVCVGGGLAGLAASVRAAECGLRVALLEAGGGEHYLCNTRLSSGVLHAAYQDVTLPIDQLRVGLQRAGNGDPALAEVIATDAAACLDWLKDHGVRFVRPQYVGRGTWMLAPPRTMATHFDWKGRGADVTLRALRHELEKHAGVLLLEHRARDLIMRDGTCVGVEAEHNGTTIVFAASAVVLADGGFAGNDELFRRYIGPRPECVIQRGAGTGRGDALRMGLDVGAATSDLNRFYGHILSRDAFGNDKLCPYPQVDLVGSAGIIVNRDGRRVFDEGLGGIYASNHIATLDDPLGLTVIADDATWQREGRDGLVSPNPHLERHKGTVHRAASIGELADKSGIAADALAHTIAGYNAALASGNLAALDPQRTAAKFVPRTIEKAPFIAIPICAGITNTMGGFRVSPDAGVQRTDGSAIPGLYAAGATIGALEGGIHVDYVGGLIKAVVFGLRAANHAARHSTKTSRAATSASS